MISKTVLDVSLIPIHYGEMTSLPEGNPDVFEYFQSKVFSVHIGDHNPFGQIPADQTMTETVNKETQTAGETQGFSLKPRGSASNPGVQPQTQGFSLKPGTVSKYRLTSEYPSMCLKNLRDIIELPSFCQQ